MDSLLNDVRYALRGLTKAPGFAVVALLTLAIGTGANATIFSFVDSLLLRPAPGVANPSSLVAVYTSDFSSGPYGDSSYPDYLSLKSNVSAFTQLAAYQDDSIAVLRVGDIAERARVAQVSGEFFDTLGIRPSIGRLLLASDTRPDAPAAVLISEALWQRGFGTDPGVLGRAMAIAGRSYTIVGVVPRGFTGLELGRSFDVWTPLVHRDADVGERGNRGLAIVGRLRPDASIKQAQAQISTTAAELARDYPQTNRGTLGHPDVPRPMIAMRHVRLNPSFRSEATMIGAIAMAAVGLVLVIACANVASMLVSRAAARTRDIAVRLALGATRVRVFRQALTESALLGIGGGALGVICAMWTADALPSFFPPEQAAMLGARVDWRVTTFTFAISLAGSVMFGAASAIQALNPASDAAFHLRGDALRTGETKRGARFRRGLVTMQVALAFVLLVASALLIRSVGNALDVDMGFGAHDAVLASVELPSDELAGPQALAYYRDVVARVGNLPGVDAVGLVRTLPLGGGPRRGFQFAGYTPRSGEDLELPYNVADAGYFDALKIGIVSGRTFTAREVAEPSRVVVVNDVLARRFFDDRAVGRTLRDSAGTELEIIGVIRSGRNRSLHEPAAPFVYYPLSSAFSTRMTLVARTSGGAAPYRDTVRRQMRDVNRGVAIYRLTTLDGLVAEAITGDRLTAALVSTSGAMALLLAAVGLYGVIAYAVVRRMREIGVRVALGAQPRDIIRLVLSEGINVTAVGILCGAAAALGATQLLRSMLVGVTATDARTFILVPAVLAAVSLIAAWIPARRALALDPTAVLRHE